ncbi:MAG: tRNA (adenosine(37)-N6)-threonylcarbamoyltransferase complex dimerization subunit type 1 TsaB [Candidatus Gracilibacteria bacterium]|nr:tRNA (adenosine(37)-N6)-threonylcarbamoyltransferase complex dimerization subunit type 1 TsaB [Candidatus Gracilibacteria bacterium]
MILLIDSINKPSFVILFDENRQKIDEISWEGIYNEASTLMPNIDNILKKNNIKYENLDNIIIVNGPGSFTGVRTTVLTANTISYLKKINLTEINFFDLYELEYNKYPIIKNSSKRDVFILKNKTSEIEILSNKALEDYLKNNNISEIYGEINENNLDLKINKNINYDKLIHKIELEKKEKITPFYVKKPNIF